MTSWRRRSVLDDHHVNVWLYRGQEWYLRDLHEIYVEHEAKVCAFEPLPVADFAGVSDGVAKIVGVSDNRKALARAQEELHATFGDSVSATNSQSYYLDITNPQANKGSVVEYLSSRFAVPTSNIATIGDAENDVAMFNPPVSRLRWVTPTTPSRARRTRSRRPMKTKVSRAPSRSSSCRSGTRTSDGQITTRFDQPPAS